MKEEPNKSRKAAGKAGRKSKHRNRYRFEIKLRAVKLFLEEGYSQGVVCRELGMGTSTVSKWLRDYRAHGEAGLRGTAPPPGGGSSGGAGGGAVPRTRLPAPVTEKIVELKRQNQWWGIKRIAQVLRRVFFMQASAETVRARLHEAGLMDEKRKKAPRNMSRPRFFERATPNQLWQTDIFTFRLGGRYAYLVAYMDDYSRYIVGADLMRSPTAQAVIEIFRVAAAEYQPPKEMLTDNGPQYATWRGRAASGDAQERIAHPLAAHHP